MTATEELRAMLDERGVEWRWEDERTTYWYVTVDGEEWGEWTAIEMGGYLHLSFSSGDVLTPAQAIAATLGCGTCRLISAPQYGEGCQECSACGEVLDGYLFDGGRCPNCRAKVVDE